MELSRLLSAVGMVVLATMPCGCSVLDVEVVASGIPAPAGSDVIARIQSRDGTWMGATFHDASCLDDDLGCTMRLSPDVRRGTVLDVQAWLDLEGEDWEHAAGDPRILSPDDTDPLGSTSLACPSNGTHQVTVYLLE